MFVLPAPCFFLRFSPEDFLFVFRVCKRQQKNLNVLCPYIRDEFCSLISFLELPSNNKDSWRKLKVPSKRYVATFTSWFLLCLKDDDGVLKCSYKRQPSLRSIQVESSLHFSFDVRIAAFVRIDFKLIFSC